MTFTESDDELRYHLCELRADLGLVKASLETAASTSIDGSTALLGSQQPTPVAPPEPRTGDAVDAVAAVARVAGRLVASALADLSIDAGPSSPESGVASAAQASLATHQMLAEILDLVVRLAGASGDSGDPARS